MNSIRLAAATALGSLAALFAGSVIIATASEPALPAVDPSAYTLAVPTDPKVERIIAEALAAVPGPLPCHPTFRVEEIADEYAGFASSACVVQLDASNFDEPSDLDWWGPHLVRHEVAHLVTLGLEDADHGDLFRSTFAHMLRPLGISEVYAEVGQEYPSRILRHGKCVYGCE